MADGLEYSIDGVEELLGKIDAVKDDIRYKGGRFALRKAAQIVRDQAIANAEKIDDFETPENISVNIALRWSGRRFKRTGDLAFRVGVLGGAEAYADTKENRREGKVGQFYSTGGHSGNPGGDTWYWRLIEFGTQDTPANPFMRSALSKNISRATDEFVSQYGRAIDRALRRAQKKAVR